MTALVDRGRNQLQLARHICNSHTGQTAGVLAEVTEAEMFRDSLLVGLFGVWIDPSV